MKAKLKFVLFIFIVNLLFIQFAAANVKNVRHEINFPDIHGYKTLKCDFHIHTVFSDGLVWPTVRVDEAWREGLDAIALTDHIDIGGIRRKGVYDDSNDRLNLPYVIAEGSNIMQSVLVIRGAERARAKGDHYNAIFLKDVMPLDTKDVNDVINAANEQGAFVFWNHPKAPKAKWGDIQTKLYESKKFGGIEVANGNTYYPEAHQWCLDKNLTMMGNSDLHRPSAVDKRDWPDNHRTMTLVFAKEKSQEAVKEALVNGRTVVWYQDKLIGRKEYLDAIFKASVSVVKLNPMAQNDTWFQVEIKNDLDIDIEMERLGTEGPEKLTLAKNATTLVWAKYDKDVKQHRWSYVIKNFLIAPGKGLPVSLTIPK